jgi:cobalt-zinc-cadmium efflux system membrane fusion protein
MTSRRVSVPSLAAGLLLAGLSVACSGPKTTAAEPAPTVEKDRVSFPTGSSQLGSLRVEEATLQEETPLRLTGRLVWDEDRTTRVTAPVSGRVVEIRAKLGARVAAGAPLTTISSPDFGQAQSDAARSAADLDAARRTYDRLTRLVERGAAPRKDLDAASSDMARARAEANRTAARLRRWGGEEGRTVDQSLVIRSPIAGMVVERTVNPGMEVRPDLPAPLFVVTDPSHLWVALDVPEADLSSVERGAALSITSPVFPGRPFPGRLDYVGESLDPATRTLKARGAVMNGSGQLKAEMYVTVEVLRQHAPKAVVVPARAVLSAGEVRYVFVEEKPGQFVKTVVSVGRERDGRIAVTSGLSGGSRVVTEGSILLSGLLGPGAGA